MKVIKLIIVPDFPALIFSVKCVSPKGTIFNEQRKIK
jgi:hypothetical protein